MTQIKGNQSSNLQNAENVRQVIQDGALTDDEYVDAISGSAESIPTTGLGKTAAATEKMGSMTLESIMRGLSIEANQKVSEESVPTADKTNTFADTVHELSLQNSENLRGSTE